MDMPSIQGKDMDGFCGRWILKQKSLLGGPAPGTTFPPFSQDLPHFKRRLLSTSLDLRPKCKFLSEPDCNQEYQEESLFESPQTSGDCNNHDEDYLFEFDIGSPASSGEGSGDIGSDFDGNTVINVIENEALDFPERRFSISSDASSSCSHRKENGGSVDGFSTIFGSISSGLGSEKRLQDDDFDEDERLEGLSVEPNGWKENCAIYLGGKDPSQRSPEGGCATPILAVSPHDSPLVSPDSCLDEENLLDDQNFCIECATELSYQSNHEVSKETPTTVLSEANKDTELAWPEPTEPAQPQPRSEEVIKRISETINEPSIKEPKIKVSSPEPEKVEINPNLHVSTDKLNTLLGQLEVDKLYPNQDKDEEEDLLASPTPIQRQDSVYEKPKLRKCSSLRTGRTPPVTPGGRKIVRFADILGLDLSEVKIFADEIPRIPKAAFEDLDVNLSDYEIGSPVVKKTFIPPQLPLTTSLVPMFNQPGGTPNFFETVLDNKICLENAFMDGPSAVFGIVRVLNISFHKSVTVRWTVNDWSTSTDTPCEYVQGSSSGNTDKFSFKLVTANLTVGSRLQFCLKYDCAGEHWDSNGGANYVFQVFLNSNPSSRNIPMARAQPIATRNTPRPFRLASHSPSQHGDDPWLRFM